MVEMSNHSAPEHPFYADTFEHLAEALRRLDMLLGLRVAEFRRMLDERGGAPSQHLYISHEEIDGLLHPGAGKAEPEEFEAQRERARRLDDVIAMKTYRSTELGIFLGMPSLMPLFGLSQFELEIVMICLAPELDRKYDRIYAYLQDDITRKRPSIDLVLTILCSINSDRWKAGMYFSDHAPLMRGGILTTIDDPQSPSGSSALARFLQLDRRILDFILGRGGIDGRLIGIAEAIGQRMPLDTVPVDPVVGASLLRFLTGNLGGERSTERYRAAVHLRGARGAGALDLALGVCGALGVPLVRVDMELLQASQQSEELLRLALREGPLGQAAIFLDNVDVLLGEDDRARIEFKRLASAVADYGWLLFMAGEKEWSADARFDGMLFHTLEMPGADFPVRRAAWRRALGERVAEIGEEGLAQLAGRFRLTPGQIRDAAARASASNLADDGRPLSLDDLFAACRHQSSIKLRELAARQRTHYGWDDLVLPDEKLRQLREICAHVKHRDRVFGEWGFDGKLSHGKGLSALFTGSPGTGKTMAASVIARELGLDLYKVDLSSVVSKYIGETEKNLSRIFREAESSTAILFFDEADALFGKRTEVADAHDRYANIETSYLLQRMEEYEGVVILATNLRENMDEAFTRRIRFVVEFPFPDESSRRRIWETHFPAATPRSKDVDFDYLSSRLRIAGGNIKNIVLSSAFAAAENGNLVTMEHILYGAKREFEKIGKLWSNDHHTK